MSTKHQWVYFSLVLVILVLCVSCSNNKDTDDTIPTTIVPTSVIKHEDDGKEINATATSEHSTPSADIVLPVTRQIPPPEIQAQVQWFDGGASWEMPPFPPNTPSIHISTKDVSSRTLTIHYSNFKPREIITTVLYTGAYGYSSEYLTSWNVTADLSGKASASLFIPENICIANDWLVYAAISESPQQKNWDLGGWEIDLFASTMGLSHLSDFDLDFSCEDNISNRNPQISDSSSRFLQQINLGRIYDGEGQSGVLSSKMEAHNWFYVTTSGEPFVVQVLFPETDFPRERIGVLDPEGSIVYECMDTIRGCLNFAHTITPTLSGKYTIRIDAFDEEEIAYLVRAGGMQKRTTSLEILIDDSDADFLYLGSSEGWRTAPYGYNENTHWTYCINESRSNWAMWVPWLTQKGYYEVFVFIPEHNAGTTQAKYSILHNRTSDKAIVQQADYANEWVSLGKYQFTADGQEYVYLDDNTSEPRSSNTTIAFDAVKFVYVP